VHIQKTKGYIMKKFQAWPPIKSEVSYCRQERSARQEILQSGHPKKKAYRGNGVPENMQTVSKEIMNLIHASYWMRNDPLPHLRRYFPDLKWEFISPKGEDGILEAIKSADYVWPDEHTGDFSTGMIVASRKKMLGVQRFRYCFAPDGPDEFDITVPSSMRKKMGITFITP
jgi:hypothetical protein